MNYKKQFQSKKKIFNLNYKFLNTRIRKTQDSDALEESIPDERKGKVKKCTEFLKEVK